MWQDWLNNVRQVSTTRKSLRAEGTKIKEAGTAVKELAFFFLSHLVYIIVKILLQTSFWKGLFLAFDVD